MKVFKQGWKSPWVPTLTGPFPKGQANAGSLLSTKNALYYCAHESFPCMHNVGEQTGQVQYSKVRQYQSSTNTRKELRRCCSPIGHNNTKHFLPPIRSQYIHLTVWKWYRESRYPGAFLPVLENFRHAFTPKTTDCPWVSEDVEHLD